MEMKCHIPVYIDYGRDCFLKLRNMYLAFLRKVPFKVLNNYAGQARSVGIIVSPRNNSGIPWCNLSIALLYHALGYSVKIIWDDLAFLDPEWDHQNRAVGEIIFFIKAKSNIPVIKVSDFTETDIDADDLSEIKRLSIANAIWNVRNVVPSAELESYSCLSEQTLVHNARKIKSVYKSEQFSFCLHQSLINNNGGLHKWFGNKNNVRVGSFDISLGRGVTGLENVPGFREELPQLVDEKSEFFLFHDPEERNLAIKAAKNEHEMRCMGTDEKESQIIPINEESKEPGWDVFIPMNILWDAAALMRNRFFSTPYDWVVETADFILAQTDATVSVRQHPHERKFEKYGTGTQLGKSIRQKFGDNHRFRFYSSTDKVNSYKLVKQSKVVLPYTSTLGIEAALLGKRVIIESDVYYGDQHFITKAKSKQDYFDSIRAALKTPFRAVSEAEKEKAWLLYYALNKCSLVYSPFGLDPTDFEKWIPSGFAGLIKDDNLITALRCLAENIPFAYVNGKKLLKQIRAPKRGMERSENDEKCFRKSMKRVVSNINCNNYESAVAFCENLDENDRLLGLYPQAFALAKQDRVNEAIECIRKLLCVKPRHVFGNLLLNELRRVRCND